MYSLLERPFPWAAAWWAGCWMAVGLACRCDVRADADEPYGPRVVRCFDAGWRFHRGDVAGGEQVARDDSSWRALDLPHDWSIEGPFQQEPHGGQSGGFLPLGVGWYRKTFSLPTTLRGRRVSVQFDGVYKNSEVWLNGRSLGKRCYGYSTFQYDLTDFLRWDRPNVLAVRVDNAQQTCRWYSGSGIYRHTWLTITGDLHVDHWGTFVTASRIASDEATVVVRTRVRNHAAESRACEVRTQLKDPQGATVASQATTVDAPAEGVGECVQLLAVPQPQLWSADSPSMYSAVATIVAGQGAAADRYETPFGIRQLRWSTDQGLLVNDQRVLLKGVCLHHDLGCLGAAFHERAMERRLEVLKSMGCNALRCSHNPPAPGLLDLCDRMGFYVIDEAFDKWGGRNYPTFDQDWRTDLESMLQRDRNHPSVILWSVGNEVRQQSSEEGVEILRRLASFVHLTDPSRKVTCAAFPRYSPEFAGAADVASLNYQEQWYPQYHRQLPDMVIVGSESYLYYRGKDDSHKAFYPVNPWFDVVQYDYVVGSFLWTGIDYLGEASAGWPCHGWNCALVDTCGFRKPISYLHESFWSSRPMVRLVILDERLDTPRPTKEHWDWPKMVSHWTLPQLAGSEVTVAAITNCPTAELLLNGRSLGRRQRSRFQDNNGLITWRVAYQGGTLEVVAQDNLGAQHRHQLRTAGKPARIQLVSDRQHLRTDRHDIAHLEVTIVDEQGVVVPQAARPVTFELVGPGRILGVDNGDLWSDEPYQGTRRSAYQGRCLAVIQCTGEGGTITVRATSPGLAGGQTALRSF